MFHAYAGRTLQPADFATLQTMNSAFLIVGTTFGVIQPAMARFTAREDRSATRWSIFRLFLRQGIVLGAILGGVTWLARPVVAEWLNVPVLAVAVGAVAVFAFHIRPVLVGFLQGGQRFVPIGLTHFANASGRLITVALLVAWLGSTTFAAVAPLAGGLLLSLVVGLTFALRVRPAAEESGTATEGRALLVEGWRLSFAALIAYAAHMSMMNLDVIVANRDLQAEAAAAYASAVVLRRVLVMIPSVITIVLFPRLAERIARGDNTDAPIARALGAIIVSGLLITGCYFLLGSAIVMVVYGGRYPEVAPLLGWLALGTVGFSVVAVWLSVFLASRPWPFVVVLAIIALVQASGLAATGGSPQALAAVYTIAGWAAATGGAVLYAFWLRPRLPALASSHSDSLGG